MHDSLSYQCVYLRNKFVAFCNQALQSKSLTLGQLYFILYVGKHNLCTISNLCEALKLDSGYATRTIHKLIENGFIVKQKCAQDKRIHYLSLSEKGSDAFLYSHTLFTKWDEEVLKDFNELEKKDLFVLLSKVIQKMEVHDEI